MHSSRRMLLVAVCGLTLGVAAPRASSAASITVYTANQAGVAFDASAGASGFNFGGAVEATFSYTGSINFNDPAAQNSDSTGDLNSSFFLGADILGYTGAGVLPAPSNANFSTLATFLGSSGSASAYQYGSLNVIDLGVLAAGTSLTITHDDGVSVYQNGVREGSTTSGATTAVTEAVTLTSTADTILYYGRENGTPSILEVSVPEPASMALLGVGVLGLGLIRRRRRQSAI